MKIISYFRNQSEQAPLIPQPSPITSSHARFLKILSTLASNINASGSVDSNLEFYMRAFYHCMRTEIVCSQSIELQASYAALGATALNFTLQVLAQHTRERHRIPARLILKLWNALVDILGMHYFYLSFILFTHTLSVRGLDENTYKLKAKTLLEIFWGAEVAPSALLAIFSNTATRNQLRKLIVGNAPRGYITKTFDAFFELLRGFAIARGIIFGIEELINIFKPQLNIFTSPIGMTARYVPSGIYCLYQSYQGWQRPPYTETDALFSKKLSWPHIMENCFTTLYFLVFTGFTVFETATPHRTILLACFAALFATILGYSCFTTRKSINHHLHLIIENEIVHDSAAPEQSNTIVIVPNPDRDRKSIKALVADASVSHSFLAASESQNRKPQSIKPITQHAPTNKLTS